MSDPTNRLPDLGAIVYVATSDHQYWKAGDRLHLGHTEALELLGQGRIAPLGSVKELSDRLLRGLEGVSEKWATQAHCPSAQPIGRKVP
jgi:hypothetical protein